MARRRTADSGQRTVLLFDRLLAGPEEARELEAFMRERIVEPEALRPRGGPAAEERFCDRLAESLLMPTAVAVTRL
jgi:hypothetical protein